MVAVRGRRSRRVANSADVEGGESLSADDGRCPQQLSAAVLPLNPEPIHPSDYSEMS